MKKDEEHLSFIEYLYIWCGIIDKTGKLNSGRENLIYESKAKSINEKIKHCKKCEKYIQLESVELVEKKLNPPAYILQKAMQNAKETIENNSKKRKKSLTPIFTSAAATFMLLIMTLFVFSTKDKISYKFSNLETNEETYAHAQKGNQILKIFNEESISGEITLLENSKIYIDKSKRESNKKDINLKLTQGEVEIKLFGDYINQTLNLFIGDHYISASWQKNSNAGFLSLQALPGKNNANSLQNHYSVKIENGDYLVKVIQGEISILETKDYGNTKDINKQTYKKGDQIIVETSIINEETPVTEQQTEQQEIIEIPRDDKLSNKPETKKNIQSKKIGIDKKIKSSIEKAIRIKNRNIQK
ncbi:MAG: hypothetical protein OEZ13_00115 [Spirochaetia bacterium]|nr:hypothetical protein [Spirochaetia bacterium]